VLARQYRLPIERTFTRRGRTIHNKSVEVKIFPVEFPYTRFNVVIGRSVAKRAVERNRLKRMVWSVIQARKKDFPLHDYLFIIRPEIKSKSFDDLMKEFSLLFK